MTTPKAWFQSLDQASPPTTDSGFNPIKRLALKKDSAENADTDKPLAPEKQAEPTAAVDAPTRIPVTAAPTRSSTLSPRIPDLDTDFQVYLHAYMHSESSMHAYLLMPHRVTLPTRARQCQGLQQTTHRTCHGKLI